MTKPHRGHRGIAASTLQNLGVNVRRAPGTPLRSVPCPTCGAATGEFCVSAAGVPQTGNAHEARRRLALRKMREENP